MRARHLLAVVPIAGALLWATAVPAAASCAAPPGGAFNINKTPIVFVGTVDSADDTGRIANVLVESVWKGEVDEHVQVKGGSGNPQLISSVDRGFDVGTRYLFVPFKGNGQVFEDNACSATQEWTRKVERQRPEGAVAVSGPPPSLDPAPQEAADQGGGAGTAASDTAAPEQRSLGWLAITAAVALAMLAAVALVLRARGRATPTS